MPTHGIWPAAAAMTIWPRGLPVTNLPTKCKRLRRRPSICQPKTLQHLRCTGFTISGPGISAPAVCWPGVWSSAAFASFNHNKHAGNTDLPIAALLKDLKQRGMLDETLVVWGGEFGRQPTAEYAKGSGRDHNSYGFTMWMAGGGIQGGVSYGTTDELGSKAAENPLHVKRLHATILHQLGLNPNRLSYFYSGLDQKLVGVEEVEPIHDIIS